MGLCVSNRCRVRGMRLRIETSACCLYRVMVSKLPRIAGRKFVSLSELVSPFRLWRCPTLRERLRGRLWPSLWRWRLLGEQNNDVDHTKSKRQKPHPQKTRGSRHPGGSRRGESSSVLARYPFGLGLRGVRRAGGNIESSTMASAAAAPAAGCFAACRAIFPRIAVASLIFSCDRNADRHRQTGSLTCVLASCGDVVQGAFAGGGANPWNCRTRTATWFW